jgi:N-acetylglucosaminyl-diphospho-decaprenol L-rhamnosyltransferase
VRPEVTVVDNRSRPRERALLRQRSPDMRLLLADRNHGYGGGANLALDGDAELVCVSNADLLPRATALAALADAALGDPEAGMVGPVFEGGTQHYHARLPSPVTLLGRTLVGSLGRHEPRAPADGRRAVVGQVSGACVVMRRELWERVGGFDEGFFLWYDDVDLAKRVVDLGCRNLVVGSAVVRHAGAGSFSQIEPATAQAIRLDSLQRYIRKHHRRWMPAARPLLAVSRALRARNPGGLDGDEPAGGLARGQEGHPPVPGEMLEVGRDDVP